MLFQDKAKMLMKHKSKKKIWFTINKENIQLIKGIVMKKIYLVLLFVLLFVVACNAQVLKKLVWEYDYRTVFGALIDTNEVTFHIFHKDIYQTEFDSLATAPGGDSLYSIFNNNPEFYDNKRHYFYMTAADLDTFSVSSDTVSAVFPKDSPGKGFEVLKISL